MKQGKKKANNTGKFLVIGLVLFAVGVMALQYVVIKKVKENPNKVLDFK
ncbi:hypothetical protein OAU52_01250 [bacterium]|nr:hypothetical protein [bacterium]